jgi:hypothetical protein
LLIAIVILAATGLYFWLGGLATKQPTTEKAVVITATVLNGNGTIAVVVLDGTFEGQYLNTTDGTLCDFGESVTLSQGQQDTCTVPPKEGTTILYGDQVGSTSFTMTPSEVPDIVMQGAGSGSGSWSQSSQADFAGGSFSSTTNGSILLTTVSTALDFAANAVAKNGQSDPGIAADASGNYVIVWQDGRPGAGHDANITAKTYWANGSVRSSQFAVSQALGVDQQRPAVAMRNSSGDYVVVWDVGDVYAKPYWGANDTNATNEVRVNSQTSGTQQKATVAVDPSNGDYIIMWEDNRGGNYDIYAKAFWANHTNETNDFQVTRVNSSNQIFATGTESAATCNPQVGMDAAGNYVVVWHDVAGVTNHVYAKTFYANNTNSTTDFLVASGDYKCVTVGVAANGDFAVAFATEGGTSYYRVYFANGTARTAATQADDGGSTQSNTGIAMAPNGDFVMAWNNPIEGNAVFANGTENGADFSIATSGTGAYPALAMDQSGDFYATWHDFRYDSGFNDLHNFYRSFFANKSSKSNVTNYTLSGNYTSEVRDTGFSPAKFNGTFTVSDSLPSGTSINYTLFFSNFSNFSVNTSESVTNPDSSVDSTGRYVRYRANFSTTEPSSTAKINSVTLTYRPLTFSLTYTVNFASGIGWVYLNQSCTPANTSFVDGPRNLGGAAFFSRTLSGLSTACNYTSFANTTTGGVIGVQTFNP